MAREGVPTKTSGLARVMPIVIETFPWCHAATCASSPVSSGTGSRVNSAIGSMPVEVAVVAKAAGG